MALVESIFTTVFDKVLTRILKDDVPVSTSEAEKVASAVTKEIAPVVVNATNSEPWYQSRILIGLLVAVGGYIGSKAGMVIDEGTIRDGLNILATIFEAGGLAYAWYGRVVGSRKKPLGQ
jgi:chemotaxis response regulator CheB